MSRLMTKPTKWHVRPAKTQISLGIRPVWSESSLSAGRKCGSLATHWAHSDDSDQTGRMPRLMWVFAERTVILLVLSRGGSDYILADSNCRRFQQASIMLKGEPSHGIMVLFVLRKLILQTRMRSHPVGLGRTFRLLSYYFHTSYEGSGETARMRRIAWAFAGRLCDKYHTHELAYIKVAVEPQSR